MIKTVEYKRNNDVDITNVNYINELVGSGNNVCIEAKLIDNKRFAMDDIVINILTFKDKTGIINALIITNKTDYYKYEINKYYKVKGNIKIINKNMMIDFDRLISKLNINSYFIKVTKLLCVRSIQQVNNKPYINYIELSLYHNNKDDLKCIKIPTSAIKTLEIDKISKSLIYLKDGSLDEVNECDRLDIKLLKKELNNEISHILLEDICIFSIGIYFNDGSKEYYNLPYYSKDGKRNSLLQVNNNKNIIYISVDEEYKYVFIK